MGRIWVWKWGFVLCMFDSFVRMVFYGRIVVWLIYRGNSMKKLKMMGIMLFVSMVLVGCGIIVEIKIDEKVIEKISVLKKVLNLMENLEIGLMDFIFI